MELEGEDTDTGLRVALVPEPTAGLLVIAGVLDFAVARRAGVTA